MQFSTKYNNRPAIRIIFLLLTGLLFFYSCQQSPQSRQGNEKGEALRQNRLKEIKKRGVLRAVVDYNSTNYFVYRGKPMGFKYELLQALSEKLGVKLEIIVSNNLKETFYGLEQGRFDVVAKNLTITKKRTQQVDFTVPLEQTSQVLVQRKKAEGLNDSLYVKSTLELAGKKVHVQKNTSYYRRLQNLSDEIGENIEIVEDTIFGVEQLVARVAEDSIDYTVCDENVALLNKTYYPNLDVSLKVSFHQNIAWAVPKGSAEWKKYLNAWITSFKKSKKYRQLYYKYFLSPRTTVRMESEFHSISGGKISSYDKNIKELASEYGWDWRLIAAVIYNESRFNAKIESWAGAYGLMQIMPSTAESLGVDQFKKPKQNIKAGILLLNWLNSQFLKSIPDSTQRVKFVLASYNIGFGHVKDAQRLAVKYGKNEYIWEGNVDFFLRNKSSEKYFKDPVVRWGYCRGEEAYNYVNRVTNTYLQYVNVIAKIRIPASAGILYY